MRLLIRVAMLFLLGLLPVVSVGKQRGQFPCGSAAFSRHGDLAELTVVGRALSLDIIRADGTHESGRTTISSNPYGVECSVFITDDGTLAAVVTRLPLKERESIQVWDVTSAKWRSSFDIVPRPGLEGRITVLGFWKGGHDLLVESATRSVLALALVDVSGKLVDGPAQIDHAIDVDTAHGRVWISRPGANSYDVFAFDFASPPGEPVARANLPSDCSGMSTQTVGFPVPDMLVGARNWGSTQITVVSSCELKTGSHSQVRIPPPRKQFLDAYVDAGPSQLEVSPSGKFFAVRLAVTRWSHFDTQRAVWHDLYVFQTDPLRQIAKFGRKKGRWCWALDAFAVGDAGGVARVATDWCGNWKVQALPRAGTRPRKPK